MNSIRHLVYLALFCLLVLLRTSLSLADRVPEPPNLPTDISLIAPTGWDLLPGLSATIAKTSELTDHFAEEATQGGALAYGRANRGALYLSWVDSIAAHPDPRLGIRTAFDGLHEAPFLAAAEAGAAQEIQYREHQSDGVAEMSFEWAHMQNHTVNVVRALGWKDSKGRLHLAIAECVLHNDSVGESRPLCDTALASLHLNESVEHEPLGSLSEPKQVGRLRPEDIALPKLETGHTAPPSASLGAAPTQMGEVLYRGPAPMQEQEQSNRTMVGIGLLLLAAAFWLTTRSRGNSGSAASESNDEDENKESAE